VQLLYLLKTGHGQTISHTAEILGRNRVTLHKWIRQYRFGGIEGLLKQKYSPGRPRVIPQWAEKHFSKDYSHHKDLMDIKKLSSGSNKTWE
jgi:transposase